MNFDDTPDEAEFRHTVRHWLDRSAPRELLDDLMAASFGNCHLKDRDIVVKSKKWQRRKQDGGWACLQWPREYGGRGASPIEQVIWRQEEGVYAHLSTIFGLGVGMCGPTLIEWGTEDQKRQFVPRIASGEDIWCQLFSEPSAGSDLAGISTRAEFSSDSNVWTINGQKIWTSLAHIADYGMLLTRTDPNVPKHDGLTMFVVNMKGQGVQARPIKQISGNSEFNEVYFDGAQIPDDQRVGPPGKGWAVALTMLMNERLSIGTGMPTGFPELLALCEHLEIDGRKSIEDPGVRSKLAHWGVRTSGLNHTASRAISALSKGQQPGPENSIGKLVAGTTMQEIATYALELQGQAGVLDGPEAVNSARFQALLTRSAATRIEGGTDEILRNIIAERVLGLPADIRPDKGIPFKQIRKA